MFLATCFYLFHYWNEGLKQNQSHLCFSSDDQIGKQWKGHKKSGTMIINEVDSNMWCVCPMGYVLYSDSDWPGGHVKWDRQWCLFHGSSFRVLPVKKGYSSGHASGKALVYSLLLKVISILTSDIEQSIETLYYYNCLLSMVDLSITPIALIRLQLSFVTYATIKWRQRV